MLWRGLAMRLPFRFLFRALLLELLLCVSAVGDEWPSPQVREVFGKARSYFVRVTPGQSWGDTYGFKGAARGPYSKAEFFRQEKDQSYKLIASAQLVNPVAPVDFFVTNRGYLVTLDNWHNRGYGKVVAFYSPNGLLIRAYELSELFSKEEIYSFQRSVSSILWRSGAAYVRPDQKTLDVAIDQKGRGFVFEVEGGSYQFCEWQGKDFRCRSSNEHRRWLPYREEQ